MKKRILSFLLACFMVASTFIISKPIVHIHAVENDVPTYSLPKYFDKSPELASGSELDEKGTIGVSGDWSLRAYDSMTTLKALTPTSHSYWKDGALTYVVNGQQYSTVDNRTNNQAKYFVNPNKGSVPVFVFTAPESGMYYFDEDVSHIHHVTTKGNKEIAVNFLVYKDGKVYSNLYSSGPDAKSGHLTGYVALEKGDELIFATERTYSTDMGKFEGEDWYGATVNGGVSGAYINDITVKKVADLPEGYADEIYTETFFENGLPVKGKTVFGQFELSGFDYANKKPIAINDAGSTTDSYKNMLFKANGAVAWSARDQAVYVDEGFKTSTGKIGAVIFTAPKSGYYALSIDVYQYYLFPKYQNTYSVEIMRENTTLLNKSENYINLNTTASSLSSTLMTAANAYLEEGEKVYYIIRYTGTNGNHYNAAFRSVNAIYLGKEGLPVAYELPMDWRSTGNFDANNWELPIQGQWQLTSLVNPADNSTMRNGASTAKLELTEKASTLNSKAPQSYLESSHNRGYASGTIKGGMYDTSSWNEWYINATTRWDGTAQPFKSSKNFDHIQANPSKTGISPAVVFTAPEDGTYSYSEVVTGVVFAYGTKAYSASATVRKNGRVINMFTPTAQDPTRTLEGTVTLKKGDILTFVFTQNTSITVASSETAPIQFSKTIVTKIGNYVDDSTPAGKTYTLPMSWYDGLTKDEDGWERAEKDGWKVACFTNPSDPSTIIERNSNVALEGATNQGGIGPIPYVESQANRGALGVGDYATFTSWYISAARRWQGGNVTVGDNTSYMRVSPNGGATGQNWANITTNQPTFVFTVPEDGLYSYSSLIIGDMLVDASGKAVEGEVTIRKNGRVISSFLPTSNDSVRTLEGTVEFKKGDLFMISFRIVSGNEIVSQSPYLIIGDTTLTKIGSAYNGVTVDYSPIFDGTSLTDIAGNVKLWSYDTNTGKLYDTSSKGDVRMELSEDGKTWYAYDPAGTSNWAGGGAPSNYIWSGLVNGPINQVGGSLLTKNIGFALVFTAPYDGTFTVDADLKSWYINNNGGVYHDHTAMLSDGTILSTTTNRGQQNEYVAKLTATAELKKGEQIIIIKHPNNKSATFNQSCSGDANIVITEVNHVCSADTVKYVAAITAGCENGNVEHYLCACGNAYADADAKQSIDAVVPGAGHNTDGYEADQTKHWNYCATCKENINVQAHTWTDGVCSVCEYACIHEWNGDNVCDNCYYDRTVDLAEENFNNALENYFNGGSNTINPVGPTTSLDRYKVVRPSGDVTGLTYKLFNLRFENGILLRHHFEVKGDIALYTFEVNGEKVTPIYAGADIYYFETALEAGKLHEADVITVTKGGEKVEYSVSAYSYIAIALEQSTDSKVTNALKALYDLNEALYTASGDRALLEITVDSAEITRFESDRPYDPTKEDITLILVVGQSNFTTYAGYYWEDSHYYSGKSPNIPEDPIYPDPGKAYSFFNEKVNLGEFPTTLVLDESHDMNKLSNPDNYPVLGGISPVFGTRWNELTGTKVVFLQIAEGSSSVDEWVPDPENYVCGCSKEGKAYRYAKSVEAYTKAYASLSQNYNIVLSGYIWNQGESDEKDEGKPADRTVCDDISYYNAYKSMHEGFMNELDLDFGGISVVRSHFSGEDAQGSSSYTKARAAQYKLCNDIDDLYMLSTVSETCSIPMMDQGNPIHYSQKVFNVMGVDMANNLYSALGLGEANEYDGIRILSKNGVTITHIDENGDVVVGSNVIDAESTAGRIQIRLSALGREDKISFKITVNGIDCSQYIDGFGVIDWAALEADTGFTSLKVAVNVK